MPGLLKKVFIILTLLLITLALPAGADVLLNYDFDTNAGTLAVLGLQKNTSEAVVKTEKDSDGNVFGRVILPESSENHKYQYILVKQLLNNKKITFMPDTVYRFSMDVRSEITQNGNCMYLFCREYTGSWNECFIQADCSETTNNMINVRFYNPVTLEQTGSYTVKKGSFFRVEAVYDADSGTYNCYCNGVKVNSEPLVPSSGALTGIEKLGFRFHSAVPCSEAYADYDNICVSSYKKSGGEMPVVLKRNNVPLSRLETGFLNAEFYADNISVAGNQSATLITAYYKNGILADVAMDTESSVAENPRLLSAGVSVDECGFGNTVKAFVLESMSSVKPVGCTLNTLGIWGNFSNTHTETVMKSIYLLNTISPYVLTNKLPQYAIADVLTDGIHTISADGISFDDGGAYGKGGSLVYGIDSHDVWVTAGKRTGEPGFTAEFSEDGSQFDKIYPAEKADMEFGGKVYSLYRFSDLTDKTGFLRITPEEERLRIRSVLANINFANSKIINTVNSYFGENTGDADVTPEELRGYRAVVLGNIMGDYENQNYDSYMLSDGSWSDIDYKSDKACIHLQRCKNMATEAHISQKCSPELAKALEYYVSLDVKYESSWYHNHITAPQEISEILLLAGNLIPSATESALRKYLENKAGYLNSVHTYTGSNELEISMWIINLALYNEDTRLIATALSNIESELLMITKPGSEFEERRVYLDGKYSGLPGIQTDYSGMFHESQLYSGGYCMTLIKKMSVLLAAAYESGIADGLYLEDYIDHILEHYRWIFYKKQMDFNTSGRYIAVLTTDENGNSLSTSPTNINGSSMKQTLERLTSIDGIYRLDELKAFARKWSGVLSTTSYAEGNRYFYKPYYMVNQKGNYMAGLRMSTDRVNSSEQVSWCNLKGKYLADGCLYVYRTTEEYNDIFAVWDWNRIPGTTSLSDKEITPSPEQDFKTPGSASDIAGGLSDGEHGVAAMQLVREGLSAKKAWFMFDDEIVCLGSDISNSSGYTAVTTVNQCISEDTPLIYSEGKESELSDGAVYELSSPGFVINDGIGYVFESGGSIKAQIDCKTGNRYDISYDGSPEKPNKNIPVSKRIFSLWADHEFENCYSYIIVPDVQKEELYKYLDIQSPLEIISNTESVMAVRHRESEKSQYVFWKSGAFDGIKVSAPCVVSTEKTSGGYIVNASALSYNETHLTLSFKGEYTGGGAYMINGRTYITAKLPDGEFSGMGIKFELKNREE